MGFLGLSGEGPLMSEVCTPKLSTGDSALVGEVGSPRGLRGPWTMVWEIRLRQYPAKTTLVGGDAHPRDSEYPEQCWGM